MDEVIDDIISMQSNYDDIQAYIDPIQMPNTVSTINQPTPCVFTVILYFHTTCVFSQTNWPHVVGSFNLFEPEI